jgi:hypothetical protein
MPKPKSNRGVGKPLLFTSVEDMQKKINAYFESCFRPVFDKSTGKMIRDEEGEIVKEQVKPFTMAGLAYALDMSRQSLLNYQNKDQYFDAIMRARRRCEVYSEERLYDKDGCNGAKFGLINNYSGWKDKTEVDHGVTDSLMEKFNDTDISDLVKKANGIITGKSK